MSRAAARLAIPSSLLLVGLGGLFSCGERPINPGPSPQALALGREVYHRPGSCVTCHQDDGGGTRAMIPPLANNPRVVGDDTQRLVKVVLHGMHGPVEVNGATYSSVMNGQGQQLSDLEVSTVLTYIRNAWGNQALPVLVEHVAPVRAAHADRRLPWTVAELNGEPAPALAEVDTSDPIAWGESLYLTIAQCASCHMPEGQGVPGSYPPLAKSPWVTGDIERLIKVTLHGVGGEMTILGNTYNNEMPGQGGLLDDDQIAATLTYIRQAWGNHAGPVYPDQVAALRERFADRHEPWPAEALATAEGKSILENVRYRTIDVGENFADFRLNTPELDALPTLARGVFEDNFIEPNKIEGRANNDVPFVVVLEAEFEAPAEDLYQFSQEGQGSALLLINDEVVFGRDDITGKHWKGQAGEKLLPPGRHRVKLYYGNPDKHRRFRLSAIADSVNRSQWQWTHQKTNAISLSNPAFILVPERDRPIVLRGRFEGVGNLGLAVGHPLRVNYAYDFARSQLVRLWRGDFVNAAGVWFGRNDKHLPNIGDGLIELSQRQPLAHLASPADPWPDTPQLNAEPEGYDLLGHRKTDGLPVFYSLVKGTVLVDRIEPVPGIARGPVSIARTMQVTAIAEDPTLHALLAEGESIEEIEPGVYRIDGTHRVVLGPQTPPATIRQQGDRLLLIAPAQWSPTTIDLAAWALKKTDMQPEAPGFRAAWQLEYQWIDQPTQASAER
ncbi:MAG: c-type cytochrome [Planctomycetota bacterium]